MRCAGALGVAVWGLCCAASSAWAAELTAQGPVSCPDLGELTFRVERRLGMPLAQAAPLRFDVRFEADQRAYSARLSVEAGTTAATGTERVLRAQGCSELADAVAVAIALALGSESAAAGSGPDETSGSAELRGAPSGNAEPSKGAANPSRAAAPSSHPDAVLVGPQKPAGAALSPALSMSLVADAGSLPTVGLGVMLGAELRAGRLALRAGGTLLFDRHVTLPEASAPPPGADMSLVLGSLSACTSPFHSSTSAFVCGGWELGRIEAIGTGVEQPRRGSASWSAPRVDAGFAWDVDDSPLRFFGQLTAATPLRRDDFYLRDIGSIHRAPAVVGRLAIGVDVRF